VEIAAKAQGRVTDAGDRSTTDVYPPLRTLCRTNLRASLPPSVRLAPPSPEFIGESATDRLLLTSLGGWNPVTADPGVAGLPLRYPVL
jgi:hypothetical protein